MSDKKTLEALLDWSPSDQIGRFEALRAAFEASENAISHQADQFAVREQAIIRQSTSGQEHLSDLAVLHMETRETFAKVFRGGFLISTWSVFESCVKDVGEFVRRKKELPFGLQDLRAGDFINQSEKFFGSTLKLSLFSDKDDRRQLDRLKNLRNLLVHHDGSVIEASAEWAAAGSVDTALSF